LATTTPERTIIDLAGVLREEQVEIALESARRDRLLTTESVERALNRLGPRGRDGTASLQSLLTYLGDDAPSESALEVLAARMLRKSDLPRPERQVDVVAFGEKFRLDFAWPEAKVVLECDGEKWHAFEHDRERWSAIVAATKFHIVWATWRRLKREPTQLLAELEELLRASAR
jgi:very-short-patch-repair endonuclease